MKVSVNRQELLAAALAAESIVPSCTPLEILRCAFLTVEDGALTIAATNQEVSMEQRIPAEIHTSGRMLADAKLLTAMLKRMREDTVTLAIKDHRVAVYDNWTEYLLPEWDAGTYPRMRIPVPEETFPISGIPKIAKRTMFAVSEQNSDPRLRCVHLTLDGGGLTAVGSDGFRIASAKGSDSSAVSSDLLLPASSLGKLARLVSNQDTFRFGVAGQTAVFVKEGFSFSARIVTGAYFDVASLLKSMKRRFTVLTDAELLQKTVSSVCAMLGEQNRFCLKFQGGKAAASCESENGKSVMELDVVPLSGTPAGVFWYNPGQLLGCLKAQSGTMTLEAAQNGALILRTDALLCLQMPVREPRAIARKNAPQNAAEQQTPKRKNSGKKPAGGSGERGDAAPVPEAA